MRQVSLQDPEFQKYLEEVVARTVAGFVAENEHRAREISLIERLIRVEEELKALREIQIAHIETIEKRFEVMDKRFEALQREMDKRFEAIDKRFEAMEKRFEAMDKRFTLLQWSIGIGFTLVSSLIGIVTYLRMY